MGTGDKGYGNGGTLSALMLGYCRGESQAFEGLYGQLAPSVFATLIEWTLDRQRAEALLDRTFQTLHQSRSSYVEGADPVPWLHEIARAEFLRDRRDHARDSHGLRWSRILAALRGRAPVEAQARS